MFGRRQYPLGHLADGFRPQPLDEFPLLIGVIVGVVTDQRIDPKTFLAVVTFDVNSDLSLPQDTSAEIASEGLLGGKYIALVPGGSDETINPGGEIIYTQSSVSLESLIGKMIYSDKKTNDDKSGS